MVRKVCLFNKCHGLPKWKPYGAAKNKAVTYSKLLAQKGVFQKFIEINNAQNSKFGRMDSYCIVDKRYSPSKGSNIDIFIFDEEGYHGGLYLEYSVHKQYIIQNCNELITFLSFNDNSTLLLYNSFIYVKSAERFKWTLFFGVLEFLIKKLNKSVIGSQFYFPLFSKYLIKNELQLLHALGNWLQSVNAIFIKTFSQDCEVFKLKVKKVLHSMLQDQKGIKSIPNKQLKRKSTDLYAGDDCLPKTKRFNSEKNVCNCKNYEWRVFSPFKKDKFFNYINILEAKKSVDDAEAKSISPFNCEFLTDSVQYSNSFSSKESLNNINQELSLILNTQDKSSPIQLLDKVNARINVTDLCVEEAKEKQPKYENVSDLHVLNQIECASDNRDYSTFGNIPFSAVESESKETSPLVTTIVEIQNVSNSPSNQKLSEVGFSGIYKSSVSFQTASGKSLKISEAALQIAGKMFDNISCEDSDVFPPKKTKNAGQPKSLESNKLCVGFHTAAGKSLCASKTALEAAEKIFKEINEEETDVFLEKQTQVKRSGKDCYPSMKECLDEDISKVLTENFFEDILFDEKENDSQPSDNPVTLNIQNAASQNRKIRKSLGGRRSLKPYTLKK